MGWCPNYLHQIAPTTTCFFFVLYIHKDSRLVHASAHDISVRLIKSPYVGKNIMAAICNLRKCEQKRRSTNEIVPLVVL